MPERNITMKPVLSKRARTVNPSATLAITAKAKALKAQGVDVVNFAAGEPDWDTLDVAKEAAIEAIRKGFTKYTPTSGIPELKEAIATKLRTENHIDVKPEQVLVTAGAKFALYEAILALVEEGDEVLLPSPYWVSYPEMVTLAGGRSVILKTDEKSGFKISAVQLEASITDHSKLLILNSPSNPTGAVYSRQELVQIVEVALKHQLWILSDEIYERLYYIPEPVSSPAAISSEIASRTITVNGASKSYSMTGWRIGYAAGPKEVIDAMGRIQDQTTSNPSSISQKAALAAFQKGGPFVEKMRKEFSERREVMLAGIKKIPGWQCHPPDGAFYCFANISGTGQNADGYAAQLLEKSHVAVIPGTSFGAPQHIRVSFACSPEEIQKGLGRL